MSRLFPDRRVVHLAPAANEPWSAAVEALHGLEIAPFSRVTVLLSNRLVRYAVVPWSAALSGAAEQEAWLRHHFVKLHGEPAKRWTLRASEAAPGAPRLASAIDAALLARIVEVFRGRRNVRLVSVQPELMSRFNAWRAILPAGGAWMVLAEADRACIALHGGAGWRCVHNGRGPWRALLERQRYRVEAGAAGAMPDAVLLSGAAAPALPGPWKFLEVAA